MSPQLALRLFGSPQVQLDRNPVEISAKKALALLVYLVLTHDLHRRDALAALFWPGYAQASARTYLRQALHQLTQALGHRWFEVNRESIGIHRDAPIHSDAQAFRQLLRATAPEVNPEISPEIYTELDPVRHAISLYADDFLAGFSLPDAPEFEQWQLFEAESLRRQMVEALQRVVQWHSARGDFTDAIESGRRWLQLDPYDEHAHRTLMYLYARAGQRQAALRQYEECKRRVQEGLHTLPEEATQSLFEAIRRDTLPLLSSLSPLSPQRGASSAEMGGPRPRPAKKSAPDSPIAPTVGVRSTKTEAATAAPTVFVGRTRELGALAQALATAHQGRGQVLFVIGGAGRGKSMLVQEFARRALHADAELLVVSGSCNAHTGISDPYLPFREILMALTGDGATGWSGEGISSEPAQRLWHAMPITLPALVANAPDLIGSLLPVQGIHARAATVAAPEAPWLAQLQALAHQNPRMQLEERRLFTQVTELLTAVALQRPLLLILEDLHWIDSASNSLLFHLSRVLRDSHILIVGTYRPDEVAVGRQADRHPLASIVGELKRQHGDIWLDLGNLSPHEGRAFVDDYLDTQPNRLDETFRAGLFRHTGGHALFTAELLRDMQERGELRRDGAGEWVVGADISWSRLPAKVGGVIEQRIGRLGDDLVAILTLASVEGESFTAEVIAHVQGIPAFSLVQRLSRELERQHRLVLAEGIERVGQQRLSRFRFRHHLFQQYLYTRLTESERAYMHEAIGVALEALHAGATEAISVQLAHHFEEAGLAENAVTHLYQAGVQAHQLSANDEAAHHLSRALALLHELPATAERDRQELALRITLGRTLIALKGLRSTEANAMYTHAYELCQRVGDAADLFAVLHGLASRTGRYNEAPSQRARQMLQVAEQLPHPVYRVSAHHLMGHILMVMGEFVAAQEHLERSFALYKPHYHRDFLLICGQDEGAACLANQCWNLWYLGYPDRALQVGQAAIELARTFSHPMSLSIPLHFMAALHLYRGELVAAHRQIDEVWQLASEQKFSTLLIMATLYRGMALVQEGAALAAIAHFEAWFGREPVEMIEPGIVAGHIWLARAYCQQGEVERAQVTLNAVGTALRDRKLLLFCIDLDLVRGELALAKAKQELDLRPALLLEAESSFIHARDVARRQQAKSLELRATIHLCRLWQMQGRGAEGRSALAELYAWFTEGFDTAELVEVKTLLAN